MHHRIDIYDGLASPARRRLLELLVDAEDELLVTELARAAGLTQANTSRHLRVLRETGLVHAERVGRTQRYSVLVEPLALVATWSRSVRARAQKAARRAEKEARARSAALRALMRRRPL
jgi:DNA-binding transcriptional ArsR family regulator